LAVAELSKGKVMRKSQKSKRISSAQSSFEYLLLLGATAVVVLLAFNTMLPKQRLSAEGYYNSFARGFLGRPANYIDSTGNVVDRTRVDETYP